AAASGEDAHAIAGAEGLVGLLHDGDVPARVELHGDLDSRALVARALDLRADDAAQDRPAPAAGVAARDAAEHGAGSAAQAGIARLDAHLAHRLHHAEAHSLLAAHLVAPVIGAAAVIG